MARRSAQAIRDARARRAARLTGLTGFALAASLPALLWHRAMELVASDFRLELGYLVTGWTGYALLAAGLLCLAPVVATSGFEAERRPRRRNAYLGWASRSTSWARPLRARWPPWPDRKGESGWRS